MDNVTLTYCRRCHIFQQQFHHFHNLHPQITRYTKEEITSEYMKCITDNGCFEHMHSYVSIKLTNTPANICGYRLQWQVVLFTQNSPGLICMLNFSCILYVCLISKTDMLMPCTSSKNQATSNAEKFATASLNQK